MDTNELRKMSGIIGKKVGMTSIFDAEGKNIPCTVIEAGPCVVTQLRTVDADGYTAVQLAFDEKKEKNTTGALKGHFAKAKTTPKRKLVEFKTFEDEKNLGDTITVEIFAEGDFVDVVGTSKGKGFQGVIKRHNQATGPMTHGSRFHRRPGSMGAVAPQVFKGKALPGQMGGKTITVQNLEVVLVDVEKNAILVKGNVPGAKKSFVLVKSAIKENNKTRVAKDLVTYNTVAETSAE